jgi:hypothetical protein
MPTGASVMTNTSVTLDEAGIAVEVDNGGVLDASDRSTAATRASWCVCRLLG